MKGYKTIKEFNLQECDAFLRLYPDSALCEEVKQRKQYLIDERDQKEAKKQSERLALQQAKEKAFRKRRIRIWIGISLFLFVTSLIVILSLTEKNEISIESDQKTQISIESVQKNADLIVDEADTISEPMVDNDNLNAEEGMVVEAVEDAGLNSDYISTEEAEDIISSYCSAVSEGNLAHLREMYAYNIDRYHSKYNTTVDYVIDAHKRYDEKFGVYGKHFDIQWNTLTIDNDKKEESTTISIILDYRIDRYDTSKKSHFIIRKYFVMDDDKKIIEEYDDIIESY